MNRSVACLLVLGGLGALLAGCGGQGKASSASNATPVGPPTTSTSATKPASGTVILTKHVGSLGTVLAAGPKRMTVYLFQADHGDRSACSRACAVAWPPVTSSSSPVASGEVNSGDLGTIKRVDGTTQVTYNGHPLYYFQSDRDAGDAYGQGVSGFGAEWYVLSASGQEVDGS